MKPTIVFLYRFCLVLGRPVCSSSGSPTFLSRTESSRALVGVHGVCEIALQCLSISFATPTQVYPQPSSRTTKPKQQQFNRHSRSCRLQLQVAAPRWAATQRFLYSIDHSDGHTGDGHRVYQCYPRRSADGTTRETAETMHTSTEYLVRDTRDESCFGGGPYQTAGGPLHDEGQLEHGNMDNPQNGVQGSECSC